MYHNSKNQNPKGFFPPDYKSLGHMSLVFNHCHPVNHSLCIDLPGVELLSTGFGASLNLNPAWLLCYLST